MKDELILRLRRALTEWDKASDGGSADAEYDAACELADCLRTVMYLDTEQKKLDGNTPSRHDPPENRAMEGIACNTQMQ